MERSLAMNIRVAALAAAVALLGATPIPAPTIPPGLPSVVQGILQKLAGDAVAPFNVDPNHVRGGVTYYKRFDLQVRLPLNTYKQIHLHQGTIINPRGASIEEGQTVDVRGSSNADGSMNADEITIL
jgi:hypothetical protein